MSRPIKPKTPEQNRHIFVRDPLRKLKHRRLLFNERTPLEDVPWDWRRWIEPHVDRTWDIHRNCWWWEGYFHQQSGEPSFFQIEVEKDEYGNDKIKRKKHVLAKRFIANLFVDTSEVPSFDVVHLCPNKPCVNPHHLQVRLDHGNQRSAEIERDRRDLLSEWEYYNP